MTAASLAHEGAYWKSASTTMPERYVRVPQRLIAAAAYYPLKVGVYSLVARLFLVAQTPVPLSAADITRYDPSLSRGAAQRALSSLVDDGWLIAHERAGQKSTYVPSWGRINGAPLPWTIGAICLDRPRHVRAICLDLRLLDLFLGKLTPHPQRGPIITRYVTSPLLGLADVGSYALLLGGLPGATPSLIAWGVTRDEQPLPLPDDDAILAQASQHTLFDGSGITLTARGLQKVGLVAPPQFTDSAQSLFFVPPKVIDNRPIRLPENVIDRQGDDDVGFAPFQSQKVTIASASSGITWESMGATKTQRESPPIPPKPSQMQHGGGIASPTKKKNSQRIELPDTEAARLLWSIHAHPTSIVELATMPVDLVGGAIAYAESEPGIESVPGWVVDALRRYRDEGWPIPQVRIKHHGGCIDVQEILSGKYGDLFRLGSDLTDLDCSLTDPEPGSSGGQTSVQGPTPILVLPCASAEVSQGAERVPDELAPAGNDQANELARANAQVEETDVGEADRTTLVRLWNRVLNSMQVQTSRHEFNIRVRRTSLLSIVNGVATIGTPSAFFKEGFENRYTGAVRDLISDLYVPVSQVRVVITGVGDQGANGLGLSI